ncbi:hypothetical protein [Serratia sp. (in: enterobacteria)]|uniref:hypothetical protein n=1 Tax=Serratia sp. (in: enterobacteria) TaxID=616 RepID=UPI00398943BC
MIEDKSTVKSQSPQTKRVFANKYIEEIEPTNKQEFITYRQTTEIWTNAGYKVVGIRYGDAASRSVTVDIRKIIEENKPLPKVKHDDTELILDKERKKLSKRK